MMTMLNAGPMMNPGPMIKGALTFIPGMAKFVPETCGTAPSASYCYGVWLKHLVMLNARSKMSLPGTLLELGPGTSLGTGIAALLSGVKRYVALDAVAFSDPAANVKLFDDLVELFRRRAGRPHKGWPDFDHHLDRQLFPSHILTDEVLAESLAPARIERLRKAVAEVRPTTKIRASPISYLVPWDEDMLPPESIDAVISHTVLSHVNDIQACYRAMAHWLRPGGLTSHQIDFSYRGYDGHWNGYWAYSSLLWKIIRGKRAFSINRLPASTHLQALAGHGFEIVGRQTCTDTGGRPRSQLAPPWDCLSDEDLRCSSLFVVAKKPEHASAARGAMPQVRSRFRALM